MLGDAVLYAASRATHTAIENVSRRAAWTGLAAAFLLCGLVAALVVAYWLAERYVGPLNAAALQLQVLERRIRKLEASHHHTLLEPLGLVRDEIRRLDQLLEDFLQLARPREFVPRPVSAGALLMGSRRSTSRRRARARRWP